MDRSHHQCDGQQNKIVVAKGTIRLDRNLLNHFVLHSSNIVTGIKGIWFHLFRISRGIFTGKLYRASVLSFYFSQRVISKPFAVLPSEHPYSPPPGEYACVPFFPSLQESAKKSRVPPPQMPPAAPA